MRYVLEGGWRSLCFCQVLGRGQGGGDLSGKCGLLKGGGVRSCRGEERLELSGWSLEAEVGRQDLEQLHRQEERGGLEGDLARIIRFAKNLLRH